MYGLSPDIDLSFLKTREVIQIAVGLYQIIFAFDEDVNLSIEGKCEHFSSNGASVWKPGSPGVAASILGLLGQNVVDVHRQDSSVLELVFSGGDRLLVFDVSEKYESYSITRPGETIIV